VKRRKLVILRKSSWLGRLAGSVVEYVTKEVFYNSFIIKVEVTSILFVVRVLLLVSTYIY
jgi:hypothetical protein